MSYFFVHHLPQQSSDLNFNTSFPFSKRRLKNFPFRSTPSLLPTKKLLFNAKTNVPAAKLTYISTPDLLAGFDDCLNSCSTDICNVSFDDIGWIQATHPIRLVGIGLRRASDLAFPAYFASISASQSLISEITLADNVPHAPDSCFYV